MCSMFVCSLSNLYPKPLNLDLCTLCAAVYVVLLFMYATSLPENSLLTAQNQSTTIRLVGMDERKRLEASYQRVYQYLCRREQSVDKFEFNPNTTEGTAVEWIHRIMRLTFVYSMYKIL